MGRRWRLPRTATKARACPTSQPWAGVSKGTLYNYFAGKKELFAAFMQRECTGQLLLELDEIDPQMPAEASLLRIGHRIAAMLASESGLLIHRMVVAEARKFPELAHAFHEAGPSRAMARLIPLIERMGQSGQLHVPDPAFAAHQLFALLSAGPIMKLRMGVIATVSDAEIDHTVREAVNLFLRGYGT